MTPNVRCDHWAGGRLIRLIVPLFLAALSGCHDSAETIINDMVKNEATLKQTQEALAAHGAKISTQTDPFLRLESFTVDLSGVQDITEETLALLKRFQAAGIPAVKSVTKINLSGTNVTDEQIAQLNDKELSMQFRQLNLRNTGISDKGLQEITNMPALTELDLRNTKVTAEGVQSFLKARADNPEITFKKPKINR
ncbi:MAG: hypothetical protein ACT4QC_09100 [Planctomycetaceae bacterium]